ncbi:SNF-related serine/threonine-protein kinase [Strongylocentrotus purpuratus]|uniref:Protein kinase domain-containing protein n=1 Tax=Strongylocentrotus purpuratus TaxID=7668 RepID=A0A7M7N5U2_STRPU|nr:SNF-related serine/threonine-protein kinase [Strongylocentrotus purpuratus]
MLVCGEPPFNETNDSETLTMIMDCKYHLPEFLSKECKSLITRMLVRDPASRVTLKEIENDAWLQQGRRTRRPSDPVITREQISEQLHDSIMDIMLNGKMAERTAILESVEKDCYDHLSATYFLLAERKLKKQKEERLKFSASDLRKAMVSGKPNQGAGGPRKPQDDLPLGSSKPGINNNSKQATPSQPSTTPPASKPVAIPGACAVGGKHDARSLDDSPLSNSPRRHQIEREHLTIHPRHGRSIVKEGIGSLDDEEYQHQAEDEDLDSQESQENFPGDPQDTVAPSSPTDDMGGNGGSGKDTGGNGGNRQSLNSNRQAIQSKICTSVLNQITEEEDEYESDEDRGMLRRLPSRDNRQPKTLSSSKDNVRQIKSSSKKFTPPPRGGYSSSDASDDDSESRRRSDRFDLPHPTTHRRGSKDGPPSSGSEGGGGSHNTHGGSGASAGGSKQNGNAGKGNDSGGTNGNGTNGGGTKGSGKERKKSNELRESLKMSNLSVNSSNSSSSYSISKYAIDPANNTPSDSDDPNAEAKTWSRKNNLRKDHVTRSDSNLYIIPKNGEKPKHIHTSPSKSSLKRDSSNLSEKLNLDLNSNMPRRTSKEARDIRKKRNRIASANGQGGRGKKDPNKKVESNCCRLI